jgi:PAS domain S-box-containing protein
MTQTRVRADGLPRVVGSAAQAVLDAREDDQRLKRIFQNSHVPMVMTDDRRRYVEANRPARLAFRLSLEELRLYTADDLTPPHLLGVLDQVWTRLLETGCATGRYQVAGRDGSRLDVVYLALARVLPGLQLAAFAPADWPEHELAAIEKGASERFGLTPREIEVLGLAADGLSGPELARQLVLSPTTINTHFKNIYEKLHVGNRAGAVAKAMRLGAIE